MTDPHPVSFQSRHIGPAADAREEMLRAIGVPSLDALIDQTIPPGIRATAPLDLPEAETEYAYLRRLRTNRVGLYDERQPVWLADNTSSDRESRPANGR